MAESEFKAGYLHLYKSGELTARVKRSLTVLEKCRLCPRQCKVNRLAAEKGVCRTGRLAMVASYSPHFGEEAVLVGESGSGTIFFSNCNLGCVFCQNYAISHLGEGDEVSSARLAAMMISLQGMGCHNINFVTPSHVVPQILEALPEAIAKGLRVPLVYNSSGYDSVETLALLDGVFDIYMPDFKFWDRDSSRRLAGAPDYPARAMAAINEMHRQVGDLVVDKKGVARRGLVVRHLVMPGGLAETRSILKFLADKVSPDTYVNVMDQYRPCGRAQEFPPIDHPLDQGEYEVALDYARQAGLKRLDQRDWLKMLRRLGIV